MSSITIHNLENDLEISIREKAKEEESLNKTIKKLLRKSLGLSKKIDSHKEDFLDLFGKWTKSDLLEFEKSISDLNAINPKDWE
ncbi:MAG: hypothetical protein KAT05_08570 [Spirochaetes bacterium]|nr:hypothetical protein [Spirochaetota bacterium]